MKNALITMMTSLIACSAFAGGGGSPSSYTALCENRYVLTAPAGDFVLIHYAASNPDSKILSYHTPVSTQQLATGGWVMSFNVQSPSVLTFTDLKDDRLVSIPDEDSQTGGVSTGRPAVLNVDGQILKCVIVSPR